MSVYKPAKSKYWHYDFQYKGRRFHGSTACEARRKAEDAERKIREAAALGIDPTGGLTLHEAASKWWLEVGKDRSGADKIWRRIEQLLRLMGKTIRLHEITTKKVSAAIEVRRLETWTRQADRPASAGEPAFKAKRYPLANATVNADVIDTLRPILLRAAKVWEEPGLRPINWAALRLEEPQEIVQHYTAAQEAAWLGQCDAASRLPLEILLTYGLRFGELFFHPDRFDPFGDPDGPRLVIKRRRKKGGDHVVLLRADHGRQIAARAGMAKAKDLDTVWFERGPGGQLVALTYHGLHARLSSAAKRAGLGDLPRVIHGARHHTGTWVLRETGNLKTAQKILGHQDIKSTMRYAHVLEKELRDLVEGKSRNSPGPPEADSQFVVPIQARRGTRAKPS